MLMFVPSAINKAPSRPGVTRHLAEAYRHREGSVAVKPAEGYGLITLSFERDNVDEHPHPKRIPRI